MAQNDESNFDLTSLREEQIPENHKSGFVAVIGRPNVGKSTVMNALLHQKVAIVSHRPQTTRVRQLGIITEPDYQMIFVDTPGIMQPRHKLDEFMLNTALESLRDADVILWLVDASEAPGRGDQSIAEQLQPLAGPSKIILGINKADLLTPDQVLPRTDAYRQMLPQAHNWLLFSALKERGLDELLQMLVDALPQGPRYYPADQVTDLFLRDIAGELVREQILQQLHDEIPHGTTVQVTEFKERPNNVTYIGATIFVERESHKQIVIGRQGAQLRQIGAAARQEIELMLDGKVFLELWVKVEPKWRRSDQALQRFGYTRG